MTRVNTQQFIPLKAHWFHIMLSLAGGEQHGYGIMQDVLNRTTGKVRLWPATLYGSIKRLIESELIEESDERPAPELDDARRRMRAPPGVGSHHSSNAIDGGGMTSDGMNFAWRIYRRLARAFPHEFKL